MTAESGVPKDPRKILLVDDSDVVAGMLGRFLETSGYRVIRARDGVEGVRKAYEEIPDLIIMDVEMPLLQGYQASRLLKNRRGVREIPIIMHTSLSEDRDKYWAYNSGADTFINKDFDNLDHLLEQAAALADRPRPDLDLIREDAKAVDRDAIFEMIGGMFDQQLFQSTIVNMLGEVGKRIESLEETAGEILSILAKVCEYHVAVLLISHRRRPVAYIRPTGEIHGHDVEEFLSICLNDFYPHYPTLDLEKTERVHLGIENRSDFDKMRLDARALASYGCFEIRGKGDEVVGTLHVGNLTNNYFSEHISGNVRVFAACAGHILENALLYNQVFEMEDKIRNVFAKFVPQEIIDDLVERQSDAAMLRGEKREVAVLFSDIRSFTTISENNAAEEIVSFLNRYFNIMVGVIKDHGGTIDKFIGDAILAIFGAPRSYPDNARRAVDAALEMIRSLPSLDPGRLVLPPGGFKIGVGIHEGVAVVGNIGSADKFDYTVIGDTVNLASRLEGLTKHYGREIIVSEAVRNKVAGGVFLREADTVKVKGKDKPTAIFSVELEPDRYDAGFMDRYEKGLKLYKMGNWTTALEYFEGCLGQVPDDPITRMFIDRCRAFRENPPPGWDGAVALDFK